MFDTGQCSVQKRIASRRKTSRSEPRTILAMVLAKEVVQLSIIHCAVKAFAKKTVTALVASAATAGIHRRLTLQGKNGGSDSMPGSLVQAKELLDQWAKARDEFLQTYTQVSDWNSLNAAGKINEMFAAVSALEEFRDRLVAIREKLKSEATAANAQAAVARRALNVVDLSVTKGLASTGMPPTLRSVITLMKMCEKPLGAGGRYAPSESVQVNVWMPSVADLAKPLIWTALSSEPTVRAIGKASLVVRMFVDGPDRTYV